MEEEENKKRIKFTPLMEGLCTWTSMPIICGMTPLETEDIGEKIPEVEILKEGSMAWVLHKPVWSPVGDEFLSGSYICGEPSVFWKDEKYLRMMDPLPHEALFMMHEAPRRPLDEEGGSDDNIYQLPIKEVVNSLRFDFCICATQRQLVDIPAMVHAAWKHMDDHPYRAMKEVVQDTKFPRVLAAALSSYVPQKAYEEIRKDQTSINQELALLHSCMLARMKEQNGGPPSPYTFCAYEEASVLVVLEQHYNYISHGVSVGACWLEEFYQRDEPPKFVT